MGEEKSGWESGCKHPLFYDPTRKRTEMHRQYASECTLRVDSEEQERIKNRKWRIMSRRYGRSRTWYIIVRIMTIYMIGPIMRRMGKKEKREQEAFREKVALCKLNVIAMMVIGFIIFGMNDVCCKNIGVKIAYDKLKKSNYFTIHGRLYEADEGVKVMSELGIRAARREVVGKDITGIFTISERCSRMSEEEEDESGSFKCTIQGIRSKGCYEVEAMKKKKKSDGEVYIDMKDITPRTTYVIYNGVVLDMKLWEENQELVGREMYEIAKRNIGRDITRIVERKKGYKARGRCIVDVLKIASIDKKTTGCVFSQSIVMISFIVIIGTVGIRFVIAVYFHMVHTIGQGRKGGKERRRKKREYQFEEEMDKKEDRKSGRWIEKEGKREKEGITRPYIEQGEEKDRGEMLVIVLIPCYSEGEEGIRTTLEALAGSEYEAERMCIVVVSDGIVQGTGNKKATPDYIKDMMKHDEGFYKEEEKEEIWKKVKEAKRPKAYSYIAIGSGVYKNNEARVYGGWYESEKEKGKRIPMILIAKIGNETEREEGNKGGGKEEGSKMPGNRGKRDSQVLLLSLLSKIIFDERMTELEIDILYKMWTVTGHHPGNYEALLMVDADTIVYPKAIGNLVKTLENDRRIMGVCGETKIERPWQNIVTMIQVYEYYLSHHLSKAFESFFGNVTCLPGCFSMYRIKSPKRKRDEWIPIITNPDVLEKYSEDEVETLHQKNLLLLGEDRYLTTLLLKTFPKRHNVFIPTATCRTNVPQKVTVLLSQRRRWVNSTIHNLMELIQIRDLCGIFCFSMQFMVGMELIGSVTLPAATGFTVYLIVNSSISDTPEILPLTLLGAILGLPVILMLLTVRRAKYVIWFIFYLFAIPFWQIVVPLYAFWHFDDFTWGDTRKVEGSSKGGLDHSRSEGEFNYKNISMKRWTEWKRERIERKEAEEEMKGMSTGSSTIVIGTQNKARSPRGIAKRGTKEERGVEEGEYNEKYRMEGTENDALHKKFIMNYTSGGKAKG